MTQGELEGWKARYNAILMRYYKGVVYLENGEIAITQREKWLPELEKIVEELNYILALFDADNISYRADEVLGGFQLG